MIRLLSRVHECARPCSSGQVSLCSRESGWLPFLVGCGVGGRATEPGRPVGVVTVSTNLAHRLNRHVGDGARSAVADPLHRHAICLNFHHDSGPAVCGLPSPRPDHIGTQNAWQGWVRSGVTQSLHLDPHIRQHRHRQNTQRS